MKCWIQIQAPNGNWVDRIGFEAQSMKHAFETFRTHLKPDISNRIVVRTDVTLFNECDLEQWDTGS